MDSSSTVTTAVFVAIITVVVSFIVSWLFHPIYSTWNSHLSRVSVSEICVTLKPTNNFSSDRTIVSVRILSDSTTWIKETQCEEESDDDDMSRSKINPPLISLVIPAYNEEDRLPIMLEATHSFLNIWTKKKEMIDDKITYEIIVVDDGSTDKTVETAIRISKLYQWESFRILSLSSNQGKGGAARAGVMRARGSYVLMVDADGATSIEGLNELYRQIKVNSRTNSSDRLLGMSIGSRAHLAENSKTRRSFVRSILMQGFHVLVTILCTRNIKDTQCGFKLFTRAAGRSIFKDLHLQRWAFDIEVIYIAEQLYIPISEVPVDWQEVEGSKLIQNRFDVIKTSLTMARDMLNVNLAYNLGLWKVPMK